jgi:hypothetical protein
MPSRDIWSHSSGTALRELLASVLSNLLLQGPSTRAVYFSSPWMSDFPLLQNHFGEFAALFPDRPDQMQIRFTEFLARLAENRPVRVITVENSTSEAFTRTPLLQQCSGIEVRFAPETYHEKGVLAPDFYIEGSMNVTFSGVFIRDEKVSYFAERGGSARIARAYLEFDRRWDGLAPE